MSSEANREARALLALLAELDTFDFAVAHKPGCGEPCDCGWESLQQRISVALATPPHMAWPRYHPVREQSCEVCGKPFLQEKSTGRFCGATCRKRAHRARQRQIPGCVP